jgi:hypothetical protein
LKKDEWRLLGFGLLAALLIELVLWPIFSHHIHLPRLAGYLIVLAIAGAVYIFAEYARRRKRQD